MTPGEAPDASLGFLESPAIAFLSPAPRGPRLPRALEGARVGPYRIVREIARGGMGAVYLAERADGQFEQRVALKVVKRGMDSDEIHRRFLAERQILARLEHPDIARLLDGGVTDGRPALVRHGVRRRATPITALLRRRGSWPVDDAAAAVPRRVRRGALRPPEPGRAPRPQAVEHPGDRRRAR